MPLYTYTAKDPQGKRVTGTAEAFNEEALIAKLHQQKLLILSLGERTGKGEKGTDLRALLASSLRPKSDKIGFTALLSFTTQLAAMLTSGLPLAQSLRGLSVDVQDKRIQRILSRLETEVQGGNSLSQAMEVFPQAFNKVFISLVKAGESSGKLGGILTQLTLYLEQQATIRRKVKAALTYPCVVAAFAALVVTFMVVKIIPKFENIYRGFAKDLPVPTKMLLVISKSMQNHFLLGVFLLFCIIGLIVLLGRTQRGRLLLDRIKLRVPVFGPLIKKSTVTHFARTLSILVTSGIPLVPAMRLAIQTVNNEVVIQQLSIITDEIERGSGVGAGFRKSQFFPEMMVQMIITGEKTGTIDTMILKAAEFYEKQVDAAITTLTTLLEPFIIAIIGFLVGGIMLAMFLPVFKLGGVMH
ncbi:MAG: type II secretion system F family protein [Deltaproteobacteria bacterium]|nr:type II secretion system F family protein [Deltaproteobacteria bacterium]